MSSADETAFEVWRALEASGERRTGGPPGVHRFVSSGDVLEFARLGRDLFGPELNDVERHTW